jgi:cytochrome b subunit of formate dehydrogenase
MTKTTPSDGDKLRRKNRTVLVTMAVCVILLPILGFALRAAHVPEWLFKGFIGIVVVVWWVSFGWIIPENCEGFFRRKK